MTNKLFKDKIIIGDHRGYRGCLGPTNMAKTRLYLTKTFQLYPSCIADKRTKKRI